MNMNIRVCFMPVFKGLLVALMLLPVQLYAQVVVDELPVSSMIYDGDTLSVFMGRDQLVVAQLPRRFQKQREQMTRLRNNVRKVYPYAVIAGEMFKNVDVELEKRKNDKHARKAYLNDLEKQLNKRFRGELSNFSINQGQILVKLIDRQTGKNCFGIIKELKGGFSAVVFQGVAVLFNNSLKREYDPQGTDKEIEAIVADLEADNYVQYQIRMQQQRAASR